MKEEILMAEGKIEYINTNQMFIRLVEFMMNPDKKENVEAFEEIKKVIVIRPFLSLEQKEYVIQKTIYDIAVDEDATESIFVSGLEISLTFNALMAYVVNIDYDIPDFYKTSDYYDVFWGSGLADYILQFCERDYNHLKEMILQAFSFSNLKVLLQTVSEMNPDSVKELTESFKSFTTTTSPATIKAIADIEAGRDPLLTSIKETIEGSAYETADKIQKEAQEAKKKAREEKRKIEEKAVTKSTNSYNKLFDNILKK